MSRRNNRQYKIIYERHYGPVPRELNGRPYDIHHVDGDHANNDPKNLIAVTVQEHFDIHYSQKDWYACHAIMTRMELSPEMKTELARKSAASRVEDGTHPWQKRPDGTSLASDLVKKGTHHLLKRPDGSSIMSDRVKLPGYVNPFTGMSYTGKKSPRYDHTVYTFKNKHTGDTVNMTQRELIEVYGLNHTNVSRIVSKKRKSHNGWFLVDKT